MLTHYFCHHDKHHHGHHQHHDKHYVFSSDWVLISFTWSPVQQLFSMSQHGFTDTFQRFAHHDDIYLMVKCLSVCHEKAPLFRIQKILLFLLFIDAFHIQRIRSFLLFLDTTFQKVSRNSKTTKSLEIMTFQGVWSFLLFLDTFHIQGILSFLLFLDTFGKGWKVNKLYYKGCKV